MSFTEDDATSSDIITVLFDTSYYKDYNVNSPGSN